MTMPGIYYGIVTQNKDPENLERIKVRLPWLDKGDTDQTYWAQLLTPMEGKKFGWYSLPDIDDAVLVMFVGGDIRQPVLIGGVWSKTDEPPEVNEDGKNNFRGYRSRTGHRMILDDSQKPKVVIADMTAKNMVGIGNFAVDGTGQNKCAVYKPGMSGDGGISVSTMEGKLEIVATGKITFKAGQSVKMNATTTVDVKADSELKLDSTSLKMNSGSSSNYVGKPADLC
ncbi:MAG: phage baseplate assembly protein V [Kofleriaceae bacterium]